MFIVYEGSDEILITTPKDEPEFLKIWFANSDRDEEDYERYPVDDIGLQFTSSLRVGF